jgi:hypothetical protein
MDTGAVPDAENRHDVGVVQPSRCLGLAAKPLQVDGVRQSGGRKYLEGHMPAQGDLLGLVNNAHAASAELAHGLKIVQT